MAFPTETVYGLGANALDAAAVARVFAAKERPTFDPIIVHLADAADLPAHAHHADAADPRVARLAARFWPGPLTLVVRRRDHIPGIVTAGLPTVGLRVPDHPVALALVRAAGVPIAAPSANRFGRVSPTSAAHVVRGLGSRVDLVLDGGRCRIGVESTVLLVAEGRAVLLRPGGTPAEAIEAEIGPLEHLDEDAPDGLPGTGPRRAPIMRRAPPSRSWISSTTRQSRGSGPGRASASACWPLRGQAPRGRSRAAGRSPPWRCSARTAIRSRSAAHLFEASTPSTGAFSTGSSLSPWPRSGSGGR